MQNKYTILMAPIWLMYPHIQRNSLGWRMGYGEEYLAEFINWFNKLNQSEKNDYMNLFPEPFDWKGWYKGCNDIENGELKLIPALSVEELITNENTACNSCLYFWGHQPSKNGEITKSCLSQWWSCNFKENNIIYSSTEQYMMAKKALLFNDENMYRKILDSSDPKEIKEYGRQIQNFDEYQWIENRYSLVYRGNYHKFIQNKSLKNFLLRTENYILVEASPYDSIWGIGLQETSEDKLYPSKWKGLNLLGFALTEVREEIKRVCKNEGLIDYKRLHEQFD